MHNFTMSESFIKLLYTDYRTDKDYKPDYIINFFSVNEDRLGGIKSIDNRNDLKLYIELIWQYCHGLFSKDRYNDTINTVDKYQSLIDKELTRLKAGDIKDDWYYGLYLFKGMAAYRLKDYKTATNLFKVLTKHDDKNENYKRWLSYSTYGQRIWLVNTINIVFGGLVFMNLFFKDFISNQTLRTTLSIIGFVGLMSNWGYEYYIKRSYRKANEKPFGQ